MKGTAKNKWVHRFVIATFVSLYFMVSIISTIHVIDFFKLSNPTWLAISLAVAFEVGAAASLAAIVILEKTSRFMVWSLFIILTAMQAMGNTYYAFTNLEDYMSWIELFGLVEAEPIVQKRILSIVSGAILPIVALGFIKSLVDYIRPEEPQKKSYIKDGYVEDYLGGETKKKEETINPRIIVKEVPVEVEKIVEKEVIKEVPVEKIVEKEVIKEVIKEVPVLDKEEIDEGDKPTEVELYKEDEKEEEEEEIRFNPPLEGSQGDREDALKKIGKDWLRDK